MTLYALMPFLAVDPTDPNFSWWWDTAQKVGAGATFVLGIVVAFVWKAYLDKDKQLGAEVLYGKERDKQTLTVMLELTALIKGIDQQNKVDASVFQSGIASLLAAIADVKNTVIQHRESRTT